MFKKFLVLLLLAVLPACTLKQAVSQGIDIATSKNPQKALEQASTALAKQKAVQYAEDPARIAKDMKLLKAEYEKVMEALYKAVGKEWGKEETKVPTKKEYVKYVQNYKSRAIVDFDKLTVTVETLVPEKKEESLRNAVVTTLLTPDDPRAVDLFSDKNIQLKGKPYLDGMVLDQGKRPITGQAQAEAFAEWLVKNRMKERSIESGEGTKTVYYTEFPLISNFSNKKADEYRPVVARYAKKLNVSESLIFAFIRTESNFNPFAMSNVPAYGMMQLVPASGGRDAYRRAKGVDQMPTKDYLFNAENNIELGTTYVALLRDEYFQSVQNPVSREYCVISGYNTGSGNVLKTFSKDRGEAFNLINAMQPPQVYEKLKNNLPYEETRQYLVKVVGYRKDYLSN